MADKKKMSVEEMLAACRQTDGGASGPVEPEAASDSAPAESSASEPAAPSKPKPAGQMDIADILAAARAEKGGDKPAASGSAPAKPSSSSKPSGSPAKPAATDVASILAAARAEKAGGAAEKSPKPAAKPAAKPKPAAAAGKAAAKPVVAAGPRDTSSILADARKPVQPGPMSKAQAASMGKDSPVAKAAAKAKAVVPPLPAKPDYAKPKPVAATNEDRRGFMAVFMGSFLAVGFSSMGAVFGLWTLGTARFMFPNILTEPPNQFKVGFPSDFAPGQVATQFKAQFGVWIVNAEYDGVEQIVALKSVCTHLGCTPNWLEAEQKFKCPCHGSGFYKEGINFEGPAPRPLERYAIRLSDDGQLEVDKSRKFQEEMGQWADPASFVSV